MMRGLFIILLLIVGTGLKAEESFTRPFLDTKKEENKNELKAFSKLSKNDIFQHPTTGNQCLKNKDCLEVAKEKCKSAKARFDTCSEIYSGSWVTTCVCL